MKKNSLHKQISEQKEKSVCVCVEETLKKILKQIQKVTSEKRRKKIRKIAQGFVVVKKKNNT